MSLSTYGGLKAAIAGLLNRDDLAEAIPDFVALFEADFDADPRTARHRRRICRSSALIENEYETLPREYLAVQSITLETDPIRHLEYLDPDALAAMTAEASVQDQAEHPGAPRYYSIVGAEIRFYPIPAAPYTCDMTVYERLSPLAANDVNWLLTYFPGLYLYGAALHSAPYLGADERLAVWQGLYDKGVEALMGSDPTATSKNRLRTEAGALGGRGVC